MGESLFLEPMSRLFQKLRSKRAPKPAEPGAEDQIRAVRDILRCNPDFDRRSRPAQPGSRT